jgi:hypothetical protein
MKPPRIAAIPLVLAVSFVFACSKDATGPTTGSNITCGSADAAVCPPSNLSLGFNGSAGSPTITPLSTSTNVTVGTSAYAVAGITSSTTNGYWFLVTGGTLRAWSIITVSGGSFSAEIPLFCGTQQIIYRFDNGSAHSYWYLNATLSGCTVADFRAQLTWDTGPVSSDIDLHLVRPGGTTNDATSDCYYANCQGGGLAWGATGTVGDPYLDVDNTQGYGPENITLSGAESGNYRVIVRNYNGVLSTHATVKIYFNDVEAARYTSAVLDPISGGSNYWTVATVNILTHAITPVNTYSATPPASPGVQPVSQTRVK